MRVRRWLLGCAVAGGMAAAGVAPARADWNHHNNPAGWVDGHWNGGNSGHAGLRPDDDWQDHGWLGDDRRWHWLPGWGPGVPVYAAPTLPPEYYTPPSPPAYHLPLPSRAYVAPPPPIIIGPGGMGIPP